MIYSCNQNVGKVTNPPKKLPKIILSRKKIFLNEPKETGNINCSPDMKKKGKIDGVKKLEATLRPFGIDVPQKNPIESNWRE